MADDLSREGENPLRRFRRIKGPDYVRRSGRIGKFLADYHFVPRRLRPHFRELESDFTKHLVAATSTEEWIKHLTDACPPDNQPEFFVDQVRDARMALARSAEEDALPRAHAILSVLKNRDSGWAIRLRIACAELIRDAGVLWDPSNESALDLVSKASEDLCAITSAHGNRFRLCSSILSAGNAQKNGLQIFDNASCAKALRFYQVACDIARQALQGRKRDPRFQMLLTAGLRHKVQLFAWDLRKLSQDLEDDVCELEHLAKDEIGSPAVKLSEGFSRALYHVARAMYGGRRMDASQLDKAERALEEAVLNRPGVRLTPLMELGMQQGRIELLLAKGGKTNVDLAEVLMDQFWHVASEHRSLQYSTIWSRWQLDLGRAVSFHSFRNFRYQPIVSYFFSEPSLSKEFVELA